MMSGRLFSGCKAAFWLDYGTSTKTWHLTGYSMILMEHLAGNIAKWKILFQWDRIKTLFIKMNVSSLGICYCLTLKSRFEIQVCLNSRAPIVAMYLLCVDDGYTFFFLLIVIAGSSIVPWAYIIVIWFHSFLTIQHWLFCNIPNLWERFKHQSNSCYVKPFLDLIQLSGTHKTSDCWLVKCM